MADERKAEHGDVAEDDLAVGRGGTGRREGLQCSGGAGRARILRSGTVDPPGRWGGFEGARNSTSISG